MTRTVPSTQAIAAAMIACGGSFVQALGQALRCADPDNERRIRETWPEYWTKYARIARGERG